VALLGLNECNVVQGDVVECGQAKSDSVEKEDYSVLYPSPRDVDRPVHPNAHGYVYLQFLFPSTTYEGFQHNFRYKIPFFYSDFWNKFNKLLVIQK
jgi:hypothetical protein